MPLPLPNLDTRRYDDLITELQALIPQIAPEWTNHNPSDPGITVIELLAWLTEATLYRLNQTPDTTSWNLIKLLRGVIDGNDPIWKALDELPLAVAQAQALEWYNERYRAVTADDFEELVLNYEYTEEHMMIVRVKAVGCFTSGIITVTILPKDFPYLNIGDRGVDDQTRELIEKFLDLRHQLSAPVWNETVLDTTKLSLKEFLDERRLVGSRVRIMEPVYSGVKIDLVVDAVVGIELAQELSEIKQHITTQLLGYLDPVIGGEDGTGWPFGRPVSIHDIKSLIESVNNVAQVVRLVLDNESDRIETTIKDLPIITELNITVNSPGAG